MRLLALFLTFAINFILLFYKVSIDFSAKTSALMLLDRLACFYVFRPLVLGNQLKYLNTSLPWLGDQLDQFKTAYFQTCF